MVESSSVCQMNKSFSDYSLYVFDLDGTLYFQKKLRMLMLRRLLTYYSFNFWRIRELFILKKFREVREKWTDTEGDIDKKQYEYVASLMKTDSQKVEGIVKRWIYDNPLDAVAKSGDSQLISIISMLRSLGKQVVVFSDYPTSDKLKALGVEVVKEYCSADDSIGALKPSGKGLRTIINDFSEREENVIMIGDRFEKDGKCAIDAGCDYLILERGLKNRTNQYPLMRV